MYYRVSSHGHHPVYGRLSQMLRETLAPWLLCQFDSFYLGHTLSIVQELWTLEFRRYGYSPAFLKLMLCYFALMKDLHHTCFCYLKKKSKGDFCFHRKRWKKRIALSICFAWAVIEQHAPQLWEGPTKLPPQGPHSASQHRWAPYLTCLCEHLGFKI